LVGVFIFPAYLWGVLIHGHLPSAEDVSRVQNGVNQFGPRFSRLSIHFHTASLNLVGGSRTIF
jgi:hypothetical protein